MIKKMKVIGNAQIHVNSTLESSFYCYVENHCRRFCSALMENHFHPYTLAIKNWLLTWDKTYLSTTLQGLIEKNNLGVAFARVTVFLV